MGASASSLMEAHPEPLTASGRPGWYAVYTRGRHEKKVARALEDKGVDVFLPLARTRNRWKDRVKMVEVPLFSGYLFVNSALAVEDRLAILKTPGAVRIVGNHGVGIPVPDEQIESLKVLVESGAPLLPHRFMRRGEMVLITNGPFMGVAGRVVRGSEEKPRLVVSIEILQRAVSVEIDETWVVRAS